MGKMALKPGVNEVVLTVNPNSAVLETEFAATFRNATISMRRRATSADPADNGYRLR